MPAFVKRRESCSYNSIAFSSDSVESIESPMYVDF